MAQYQSVITLVGQGKVASALANGPSVNITQLSAGDGNGQSVTPIETQNALVHEVWRGNVLSASRDPANPTHVIVQAVIPVDAGPFTVRELALWTSDGACFAVMSTPEVVKTTAAQGATQEVTVSFRIVVDTAANITVTLDPAQLVPVSGLLRAPFIAVDAFTDAPPANPAIGALYVVSATPTGAFAGLAHRFVQWNGSVWVNAPAILTTIVGDGSTGVYWRRTATGWVVVDFVLWLKDNATLTVGPGQQFATIAAAYDWLRYKLAAPDVLVTLQLTAGQHIITSPIRPPHLNSPRIAIKGAALAGAFPVRGDVVASAATTLTTLRARFATEIVCQNCNGFEVTRGQFLRIENLLISGGAGYSGVVVGDSLNAAMTDTDYFGGGQVTAKNSFLHGFSQGWWCRQMSNASLDTVGASHCAQYGMVANNGSYIVGRHVLSCRNANGIYARDGSNVELTGCTACDNAQHGVLVSETSKALINGDGGGWKEIIGNGGYGIYANLTSRISIYNSTVATNPSGPAFAQLGSYIVFDSTNAYNTGAFSPALNTEGNYKSYIYN